MKNIQTHLDAFRPVIAYEQNLGRNTLTSLRVTFFVLFVSCLITIIVTEQITGDYSSALLGSAMIFFALWLEQTLLYFYHNSFYFKGFDSIIGSGTKDASGISYEVAKIILSNERDITAGFVQSELGLETIIRCGLSAESIAAFTAANRIFLKADTVPLTQAQTTSVYDLGSYIYMYDLHFKQWLNENAVTHATYLGALQFVVKNYTRQKNKSRWWGRDQLSLHTGLGRNLANGIPYELERFTYSVIDHDGTNEQDSAVASQVKIIQKIEQVLAKNRQANILLIAESSKAALDILSYVQTRVSTARGLNALAGLHFSVLDYIRLLATYTEKHDLENELTIMFDQAALSGTQVVIIPNFSHFIAEAALCQVNVPELIAPYLALPTLHIIGIDTPHNFHKVLHQLHSFTGRFEEILLEPTNLGDTVAILEPIALRQEKRRGVIFTYSAITSIAEHADRNLTVGTMPERAIDFIHEIAQLAAKQGTVLITENFIDEVISNKTGIPLGSITPAEKDRLLNLENLLHERVVGQERAVHAIASTMRRARVSIERADKPIGSFLFLGGTGVGKTETAKALADTFFGDETKMIRFDMSEFSANHTLQYLIGDGNGTGSLTDALIEHPYSVLLLDEFEKAAESVKDLFLQILDEGYFTSTHGTKVNARNTIIIATSNAGGDLIYKTSVTRQSLPSLDADIIAHIIETGVFKPELINRFDNTIIYEPLDHDQLQQVAKIMIGDLTKRVTDQGYNLLVTPHLISLLVDKSNDPHSGGRKITRIIQDVLEEKIATKIISGEVKRGGYLHLDVADFTTDELLF